MSPSVPFLLARRRLFALSMVVLAAALDPGTAVGTEPPRVVALGGAITEILYALHLEDRLVAVDTTSLYPPAALKDKLNVGYVRALSAEGILSAKPSLILAIDGAGPTDALKLVQQTGVKFVTVPDQPTPQGVLDKIRLLGRQFDAEPAARTLQTEVAAGFDTVAATRAKITKPVRVLFVLSLQNGRSLVGGRNTAADGMIGLAGAVNAAGDIDGYKPMTDEAIAAAAPDVVLTMQNGGHQISADTVFALPAYATTPAAKSRALVSMDGLFLLGFGPRTPDAALALIHALYPTLAAGP